MSTKPADKFVTLRLDEPTHYRLVRLATANDRSVSAEIRRAIRAYIEGKGNS